MFALSCVFVCVCVCVCVCVSVCLCVHSNQSPWSSLWLCQNKSAAASPRGLACGVTTVHHGTCVPLALLQATQSRLVSVLTHVNSNGQNLTRLWSISATIMAAGHMDTVG